MKLVTFTSNAATRIGVLKENNGKTVVIDLSQIDPSIPRNMIKFLEEGDRARIKADRALEKITDSATIPLEKVKLEAPILKPGKIMCVGLNYRDHVVESGMDIPEHPTIFAKYSNVVIGPNDPIVIPKVTDQVDWEGELGFIIGKTAKYISINDAMDYVAGYVVFNDVSGRDYQLQVSQWTMGKTFDTFGPMGPSLVTTDEILDPSNLNIRTRVDDEIVQESNTKQLIFNIPHLLSFISSVMTLQPGDLVSTGTPAGVGFAFEPQRFMLPGQTIRVEIEKLGTLANPVAAEE